MLIAFTLSMPNVGSWNGKWSGEENFYCVVRQVPKERADEILNSRSFYYDFGDGWGASISLKQVDSKEAAKLRKKSKGFCGYEWMIAEIVKWGKIYGRFPTPDEQKIAAGGSQ